MTCVSNSHWALPTVENVGEDRKKVDTMNVKDLYTKYLQEGKPPKEAAKLAQEKTGQSVVTGRPIKNQIPYRRKYVGQYQY